ncbi:MAG: hypothetical protein KDB00_20940 [Planctomycetales bacterium]|nr:hypothetical protein [Planctomycetales bacterium]
MALELPRLGVFVILFFAGKLLSLLIYQLCWSNGLTRRFDTAGALMTFLRKPVPWLIHVPLLLSTAWGSWDDAPLLQVFVTTTMLVLATGAVGRFGAVDLCRFFVTDRIIVIALSAGVYFHPIFIYPALVSACCLQYTISGWPLGPGYSNLLGFEFIRGSACVLMVCVACSQLLIAVGLEPDQYESLTFAVVLGYQASTYLNNALAKAVLGDHWYSWITQNRVQCLVVNAYLRGWGSRIMSTETVIKLARLIGLFRVPFCAITFAVEAGCVFALTRVEVCITMLISLAGFHSIVFLLTGLLEWEYVVNHLTICLLIPNSSLANVFSPTHFIALLFCAVVSFAWIGWLRLKIVSEFQTTGSANRLGKLADAADLLMAWWDSPYMRMFSFTAITSSGREVTWSVSQMSPYDTALTDIHTHIMLLGQHQDLDPRVASDRDIAASGVWGLITSTDQRDRLYQMMDEASPDVDPLRTSNTAIRWRCDSNGTGPTVAMPLWHYVECTNRYLRYRWFQLMMRWPHFPGEDMVPDVCPLVAPPLPPYRFDEPVVQVTLSRIKTFYTGDQIVLVDHSTVGTFHFDPH